MHQLILFHFTILLCYVCFTVNTSDDFIPSLASKSQNFPFLRPAFFGARLNTYSQQNNFSGESKFARNVENISRLVTQPLRRANMHDTPKYHRIFSTGISKVDENSQDLMEPISMLSNKTHVYNKNGLQNQPLSRGRCIYSQIDSRRKCLKKIKKKRLNTVTEIEYITNNSNAIHVENDILQRNNADNTDIQSDVITVQNLGGESFNRIDPRYTILKNYEGKQSTSSLTPKACSCYWNLQNCGCNCKGSLNYDEFMALSRKLHPCQNFTFNMTDGHFYALPPNLFSNLKLVGSFNLLVSNATFEYLFDPTPMASAFTGVYFKDSASIELKNVNVRRNWNWTPLEQLKGTHGAHANIFIEDCILKRLTSDFSNVINGRIGEIDISNSNLEMIGSAAFETFENMTHIQLPNNKISNLRRLDFPGVPHKLEKMDLRNNQLRTLEDNLFTEMPSLKEVTLAGNPLVALSQSTFQDVINKVILKGISDIPLLCDCHLKWLKDSKFGDDNVIKRNMKGAVCKKPGYLRGTPFDNLSKEHLVCH